MSAPPALSPKEAIWLACQAKTCCHAAFVVPTGRDVWRISRALDAPPWSFLVYFPSRKPRRDAFALDRSERRFRLALAKGPSRRTKASPPCIFLMRTRGGAHRCSLGDLRPAVCRAFPSELVDGVLCLRPDAGCTCRAWTLADVDLPEERRRIATRQREGEEYCAIVERWNARVAGAPGEGAVSFFDFCDFLLEAYDDLGAGAPGEAGGAP